MNKRSIYICTIAVILSLILCLSLAGCKKNVQNETTSTDSTGQQQQQTGEGNDPQMDNTISVTTGTDENDPTLSVSIGVADADDDEYDDDVVSGGSETTETQPQKPVQNVVENEQEQTTPNQEGTTATTPAAGSLTYAEYLALSKAEKIAYYQGFNDPEAFTLWFNNAQKEYNDGAIEIGDKPIDFGDILNP